MSIKEETFVLGEPNMPIWYIRRSLKSGDVLRQKNEAICLLNEVIEKRNYKSVNKNVLGNFIMSFKGQSDSMSFEIFNDGISVKDSSMFYDEPLGYSKVSDQRLPTKYVLSLMLDYSMISKVLSDNRIEKLEHKEPLSHAGNCELIFDVKVRCNGKEEIIPLVDSSLIDLLALYYSTKIKADHVYMNKVSDKYMYGLDSYMQNQRFSSNRSGYKCNHEFLQSFELTTDGIIKEIELLKIVNVRYGNDIRKMKYPPSKKTVFHPRVANTRDLISELPSLFDACIENEGDEKVDVWNIDVLNKEELNLLNEEFKTMLEEDIDKFNTLSKLNSELCNDVDSDGSFSSSFTSYYCKNCKKTHLINGILLSFADDVEEFECIGCGCLHNKKKHMECNKDYYVNTEVFDHIEDQGKIRIRNRILRTGMNHSNMNMYILSVSEGFTIDIKNNRAYFYRSDRKSKYQTLDIGAFSLKDNSCIPKSVQSFGEDKNGLTIYKEDKLKYAFIKTYDLIDDYMGIKFSKEDILIMARDSIVYQGVEVSEYNSNTYILYQAIQILGEYVKNPSREKEEFGKLKSFNNKITNYYRNKSINNGAFLKNNFNMPNSIRKEILKHPWKMMNYLLFKDLIDDVNNLKKTLDAPLTTFDVDRIADNLNKDEDDSYSRFYSQGMRKDRWLGSVSNAKLLGPAFAREYRELKSLYANEALFVNRILLKNGNQLADYLYDTSSMLRHLKRNNADIPFNRKSSLKRLHDDFTSAERMLKKENRVISYKENEEKLQYSNGKYSIVLAEDTFALVTMGVKLNICVGGYDSRAINKNCTIMKVVDKDNKHVACLELRETASSSDKENTYFRIIQAKAHSNSRPTGELRDFLLKWVEDNKINKDTYDFDVDHLLFKADGFDISKLTVEYFSNLINDNKGHLAKILDLVG